MRSVRRPALIVGIMAFTSLTAAMASAQRGVDRPTPAPIGFVRIEVADAAHNPLGDVILAVLDSADNALFVTRTDSRGRSAFGLQTAGRKHLVARKIGFLETRRLLRVHEGDTLRVSLVLARVPPQLDTVRVTARRRSDDYVINAAMIANIEHHYVKDAYDALRDLNPGMLGDGARGCRPAMNVWVNGVHVRFSPTAAYDLPVDESFVQPAELLGHPGASDKAISWHPPHDSDPGDVLDLVRPQDIADIRYTSCLDNSIPGHGTRNAIFITLKPGIVFDEKLGSMPADSLPDRRR
jgi:hypothetical protein